MPTGDWLKSNPKSNPNPRKECPDKRKLKRLYLEEMKGSHAIAKEFCVTQRLVMIWLNRYGIPRRSYTEAAKLTLNGFKENEAHPLWVGSKVSYQALHSWIRRNKGTPRKCEHCGTTEAKKYEWANIGHTYKRNLNDWIRLCTACHRKMDNQ